MFTDIQSGDYSLMPESPAFELGIHEIILGNFGVQESLRYASSLQWLNEQNDKKRHKNYNQFWYNILYQPNIL